MTVLSHDKHETDGARPEFEQRLRLSAEEDALQARVRVCFCSRFQCCLVLALCLHLTGLQARIQEGLLKAKLSDSEQLIAYMKTS